MPKLLFVTLTLAGTFFMLYKMYTDKKAKKGNYSNS